MRKILCVLCVLLLVGCGNSKELEAEIARLTEENNSLKAENEELKLEREHTQEIFKIVFGKSIPTSVEELDKTVTEVFNEADTVGGWSYFSEYLENNVVNSAVDMRKLNELSDEVDGRIVGIWTSPMIKHNQNVDAREVSSGETFVFFPNGTYINISQYDKIRIEDGTYTFKNNEFSYVAKPAAGGSYTWHFASLDEAVLKMHYCPFAMADEERNNCTLFTFSKTK